MITDEMVDVALAESGKTRRPLDPSGRMRMRAALNAVVPLIAAQARLKALEEAAIIADENGAATPHCDYDQGVSDASETIATAIRALKEKA